MKAPGSSPNPTLSPTRSRVTIKIVLNSLRAAILGVLLATGALSPAQEPLSGEEHERDGQALAAELRASVPEKDSEIHGVLKIRSSKPKSTNEIPIVCKVHVSEKFWETTYEAAATKRSPAERLVVRHFADKPNEYLYARAASPEAPLPEAQPISRTLADVPFAGSDFWLTDFGLDFLHWPVQRRIKGELRLGQACHVLESVNPAGDPVRRVKSWIDKDSGGILVAEAYDSRDKLLKEFSLHGSSFKKVNGRWQLEKMEIRNVQTGSQTTLKFNLPKD